MKNVLKFCSVLILAIVVGVYSHTTEARDLNPDAIVFDPATDGGNYFSVHDAQTLLQWRYHAGIYADYAHSPLELRNVLDGSKLGVVDDLIMMHAQAALGLTDWFSVGASVPVIFYETFRDPNVAVPSTAPRETHSGVGDIRVETKFRLLDNFRYPVGIAIVPFATIPTGKGSIFLGHGKPTGGGKVVAELNIKNMVWLALNFGYQFLPDEKNYYTRNADAIIDDLLIYGAGIHGKINDQWSLIAEVYGETVADNAFSSLRQSPLIARGGARFTPRFRGNLRGLSFTAGGGGGFTKGIGNPDFQVLAGINYRKPRIVELEEPGAAKVAAELEEKIIITQKIHFEFNRSQIRPISYPILDDVVGLLNKNAHLTNIRVEGHTDAIGSDSYNMNLSQKRAQAVVDYLVGKGIRRDRLEPVGYGESKPIADNSTTEGRAKNRRTEFTVVSSNTP